MDQISTILTTDSAKNIIKRLSTISGGNVLDVATGDGAYIGFLKKSLKDYESFTGVDISSKLLAKAEKTYGKKDVSFIEMNAESLTFDDNSFDIVSIANSLHHLQNLQKVLTEIKRVLKPNGLLIVEEQFSDRDQVAAQVNEVLMHELAAETDSLLGIYHHKLYSIQELKQLIITLGFIDEEIFRSSIFPKCLFCKYLDDCINTMRNGNINRGLREISTAFNRLKDRPEFAKFYKENKARVKNLRKQVREHGYASSSIMFFIVKK
ncbi:MAG: class I SAM-dependent methyltransferase [Asgard group archaeon]|nr:class I SAM-dependent methyltransferase [Asgard group archaeon]